MAKRVLLGVQELRRMIGKLSASIEMDEHTVLTSRGKPFAVVVPIEWYREAARKMKDPTEY
jgi:prevent-host-death family protein